MTRFIAPLVFLLFLSLDGSVLAYENPDCPTASFASYDPVDFNVPTSGVCVWKRPTNVKYVVLQGCGAGGGGERLTPPKDPSAMFALNKSGRGGAAGIIRTVVVGPLTQDEYRVTIPSATEPAVHGAPVVFEGSDIKVVFPGGLVGGGSGRASVFAAGGKNSFEGMSDGGDAGLGAGGDTASNVFARVKSPATNGGVCAGGGGGLEAAPSNISAGKGGHGWLLLLPSVPQGLKVDIEAYNAARGATP